MTGEILSHFEILETLGEGGMGVVYKARDTKLDRIVAIKLLPKRLLEGDLDRERFSLEAKAAANLNHANICTVYEYDEVDGQALIAMECIEGPSLRDRIADGRLSLEEATRVAKQIASGLAAAHAKGVVHRDIKPGNVLLMEDGTAKITDFGLAKLLDATPMTQTGVSLGTIMYMSPEQARGEAIGPATDVWALGVVLFEMLTGSRPFPHDYQAAILYAVVNEDPQNLDVLEVDHGPEIRALVERCLSKDPTLRPSASEVSALLGGDTTISPTVDLPVAKTTTLPWKAISLVVGAVILGALALFFYPKTELAALDLTDTSLAILPLSYDQDAGGSPADSSLKLTVDGLLQTVSGTVGGVLGVRTGGSVLPFGDIVEMAVATPEDAAGKLGAEYAIVSRIAGYDPVPTLSLSLVRDGSNQVGEPISVPILLNDLQNTYEATLGRIGDLLGIPDSLLIAPVAELPAMSPEVFQLYTRGVGLLQQRSSIRSLVAAEGQFKQALALDPRFAAGHAALGRTDLYRFETTKDLSLLDEAERHCDEAIRLQPDLIDAYVTLGAVFGYTGKPGQAQRALEDALSREPFNAGALLALAEVQEDLGEHGLAEATYKRAIGSSPDYWGGYNRLGKFYIGRSQWEDAVEQFQKVVDLAPSNSIGYRNLGSVMYYQDKTAEAQRFWELSLEIEPVYSIYNNLGITYFYNKDYARAASAYEKALEINDKDHRVWGNLATAYYWMNADRAIYLQAKRKAAEMAEEFLSVNPSDLSTKAELAGYYSELGEDEKAKALLEDFGERPDPDRSSHLSFQIGASWEELGNREKALRWIGDALQKGYGLNEITEYPGLGDLRADPAFIRIMEALPPDSTGSQ